ncbi:MAG TPA: cupin domain-containing protein [Aestuariivirgaceae bacterium]|nr:cupin domain-containing protein [Aestuariivirgaceae bacterium]
MTPKSAFLPMLFLAAGALIVVAQEPPKIKAIPVAKVTATMADQPLAFPSEKPQVVVGVAEFAPGAVTPRHKHPALRYVYVLEGALTVEMEGGMSHNYPAGSFIVESMDKWHLGKNAGTTPTKILIIDQVVEGRSNVVTE